MFKSQLKSTEEDKLTTLLVLSQALLYNFDDITPNKIFRHELKFYANQFQKELEKSLKLFYYKTEKDEEWAKLGDVLNNAITIIEHSLVIAYRYTNLHEEDANTLHYELTKLHEKYKLI